MRLRKAALAPLLIYALATGAVTLRRIARYGPPDDITQFEQAYAPLRKDVSAHPVLGYVDVQYAPGSPLPGTPGFLNPRDYVLAQYTLAPSVLVYGTRYRPIVGHGLTEEMRRRELDVARDYGNGLMLLK